MLLFQIGFGTMQKRVDHVDLENAENAPFLASIGVDTAEIWPSEACPYMHADPLRVTGSALATRLRFKISGFCPLRTLP